VKLKPLQSFGVARRRAWPDSKSALREVQLLGGPPTFGGAMAYVETVISLASLSSLVLVALAACSKALSRPQHEDKKTYRAPVDGRSSIRGADPIRHRLSLAF
jgi:hypothetical protein